MSLEWEEGLRESRSNKALQPLRGRRHPIQPPTKVSRLSDFRRKIVLNGLDRLVG